MPFRIDEPMVTAGTIRGDRSADARRVETEVVELFDRFRSRLLRYLLSSGLSACDAEEVIQEAFFALFRHLELGKDRSHLDAWLFRVVHNLALKRRDQLRRDASILSGCLEEDCTPDPNPTPEDTLAYQQTQHKLRSTFRILPEQDQRCLALRAEGLRYREIAQVLQISLGAVSISLTRSLARLGRVLER